MTKSATTSRGLLIGPGAGIGAGLGLLFALLGGVELPMALVFGATIGLLVGVAVDALSAPVGRHDDPRHPLTRH